MDDKIWYVRSEEGAVYGPASEALLLEWVKDGRVDPSGYVSKDRINWVPPQTLPELEMKWLIETELGKYFGPFHRELVKQLVAEQKMTVALIEHNMGVVRKLADYIYFLHEGTVYTHGTQQDVLDNPEVRDLYTGNSGGATL